MNATFDAGDGMVTVSVVHSMPSIYASGNRDAEEIAARAPRMRAFARSRARSLCIDGAYDVVKEETGMFGGLLTRTMGSEIAGMARDTTFAGEYRCIFGTQES